MDIIEKAMMLATSVHKDQEFGLYMEHHIDVCFNILTQEYFYYIADYSNEDCKNILAAMILHDVIEDSNGKITYEYLVRGFGPMVASIVLFVTDGEGRNRKERKQVVYDRFKQFRQLYLLEAKLVKLIDRLANVRRGGKLDLYMKEHKEFKEALYVKGEYEELWNEIEEIFLRCTLLRP